MTTTNITNFRKNAFNYVEQTIKYNEPLNISTKDGDAVLLSAEDYSGLMETLYLVSVPGMREKIMDGLKQPLDECLDEDAGSRPRGTGTRAPLCIQNSPAASWDTAARLTT